MEKSELFEGAIVHLKKGVKTIYPPDLSDEWRDAEDNPEKNPFKKSGVYVRVSQTHKPGMVWCRPIVKKEQFIPFLAKLEDLEPAPISKGLMRHIGFIQSRYTTGQICRDSYSYPTRKVRFCVDFKGRKVRKIRIGWVTKDPDDEDDWQGSWREEYAHLKYAHELQRLLDYVPDDENLIVGSWEKEMARVHYFGRNATKNIGIPVR